MCRIALQWTRFAQGPRAGRPDCTPCCTSRDGSAARWILCSTASGSCLRFLDDVVEDRPKIGRRAWLGAGPRAGELEQPSTIRRKQNALQASRSARPTGRVHPRVLGDDAAAQGNSSARLTLLSGLRTSCAILPANCSRLGGALAQRRSPLRGRRAGRSRACGTSGASATTATPLAKSARSPRARRIETHRHAPGLRPS